MPYHILIAEDDRHLQRLFAKALRTAGFEIATTHNGADVLRALSQPHPYALLVLDLGLRDMQGVELLRRIHNQKLKRESKIIVITGNHLADEQPEIDLADLFLLKPVDIKELVLLVRRLLAVQQDHKTPT